MCIRDSYDVQEPFFEKDYDTENFDEIQVPSVWQMAGYDTHQYLSLIHIYICYQKYKFKSEAQEEEKC